MWWIESMDLKLKTAIPAPRAPQSSLSPNTRVHHRFEKLPFPPTLLTRPGTPLCTPSPWEQPQIAWTRFMLDFGGLFNRLLLLQHLTKFVPKNSVQKKEKKKKEENQYLGFLILSWLQLVKLVVTKMVIYVLFLIVSPWEQLGACSASTFFLTDLKPAGYCMFCKCWSKTILWVLRTYLEPFSTWQNQSTSHASPFLIKMAFLEEGKRKKFLPKICYLWKTNLLLQDRL